MKCFETNSSEIEVQLEEVKIVWEKEKWYLQSKGPGQRSFSAKSLNKKRQGKTCSSNYETAQNCRKVITYEVILQI